MKKKPRALHARVSGVSMPRRRLAISLGNTSLFVGVFEEQRLAKSFRLPPADLAQLLGRVGRIDEAVLCSVVPLLTPDVVRLVASTWKVEARTLSSRSKLPFRIGYIKPQQLGTDRIAAACGAHALYPRQHTIVVDCGTATTVTALHGNGTLLGGAIFPGLSLWPEMLASRTAQLPKISVRRPRHALARSTVDAITSGVFHGHLGAMRELVERIRQEAFGRAHAVVIGTGGHAPLFATESVFTRVEPALVLQGLRWFAANT